ncbi:MAG: hypothetical protein WCS70_05065 [Verrucomicrobiota bacterium]
MSGIRKFERRDWLIAAAVGLVSFAMRVPFRSAYAYHWDGAQFALAMEHANLRVGLPHAPGYFLYVLLGRAMNWVVGEPHASLVWISVVAGAVLAALGLLLGTALYGRRCGVATGVILATSPLCWFHSEVALTTILDGALVTATMLVGWRALQHRGRWGEVVGLAALLAAVAGNRPQTALGLLPVWLFVFWNFSERPVKLAAGLAFAGLFSLLWFLPLLHAAGGWDSYLQLLVWKLDFDAVNTPWQGGLPAVWASSRVIGLSCWTGLLAAGLLAIGGWARRMPGERLARAMLARWILPLVVVGLLSYTTMPGYVLCYFPALAILASRVCARWFLVAGIAVVNGAVFLGGLPVGLPLTAPEIRLHDEQLAGACGAIRTRYRPDEVLLCHRQESFQWGLRQFQYHLPEFTNALLGRDRSLPAERAGMFRICRGTETVYVADWKTAARGRTLLLVGESVAVFADRMDVTRAVAVPGTTGVFELRP